MGGGASRLDEGPDGEHDSGTGVQDKDATAGATGSLADGSPAGGAPPPAAEEPDEAAILAHLVQQLGSQPDRSMALSAIRDRLTEMNLPRLRQIAEDTEYLQKWLQKFPGLLELTGPQGEEQVRLMVGRAPAAPSRPAGPLPGGGGGVADATGVPPSGAEPRAREGRGGEGDAALAQAAVAATLTGESPEDGLGPCTVQLRGLPFRATIADIKAFLGDHAANLVSTEPSIRLLLNRDGKPSGFARLQFTSPQAAQLCREQLHKQPMGDRYVEVLACVDRTTKTRQRRAAEAGALVGAADACGPEGDGDQERVLQECREHMRSQGPHLLLSMLGIALSAPARNYLRRTNLGLKHFLARHPEFRVEGPKGGEKVLWAGQGGKLGVGNEASFHDFQNMIADPTMQWAFQATMREREPATPKPLGGPSGKAGHSNSGGHSYEDTPSNWGTPPIGGSPPQLAGAGAPLPDGPGAVDFAAAFGGAWPPYWAGPWDQAAWAGWPHGEGMDAMAAQAAGHGEKRRGAARGDGPAARSHAHLHPESHPFAHLPAGGAGADDKAAGKGEKEGANVAALRLRGLPFSVTVQDVLAFFSQHHVAECIADGPGACKLLPKANGRPSGQAVVQMRNRQDAEQARDRLQGQMIDTRYIEVFVYGGEDGALGTDNEVSCSTATSQLPDGVPQWGMGMSPWMPWEVLEPHSRAAVGAREGLPADAAGPAESSPENWSALFQFLYHEPQPDAGGLGVGGAFLPGGGPQSPANGGLPVPVPVDMSAQPPMQTLRV